MNIKNRDIFIGWVVSLFLLISGSSALIYQVLWVRLLSLSIGSSSASISTVLVAFFLGLGLGSYFAGDILKRFNNALKIYLFVEIAIAISAILLLPILLNLDYYISMLPILKSCLGLKFLIVMLLLLIPTFLIGTTFPLLISFAVVHKNELGFKLAHFYAFNTAGAVVGALLAGLVLIPAFGLDGTVYIAASLNLFIALTGFFLYSYLNQSTNNSLVFSSDTKESKNLKYRALIVLFVTGFSAMATEVGWMKFLIVYTGNTIYGFSLILSMFLIGLTIGAWIIKSTTLLNIKVEKTIFIALILLSSALLAARAGLGVFPELYEQLNSWQLGSFAYRWSKYFAMFLLILPATALFGAIFPIALKFYSDDIRTMHRDVGRAYAVNIVSGVLGSAIAGFFIIPYYSTDILLTTVALLVLFSSLFFIDSVKSRGRYYLFAAFALIFLILSHYLAHIDYRSMIDIVLKRSATPFTANVKERVHYLKEGKTGVISVHSYENTPCTMRLSNNGMSESLIDICKSENLLLSEFLLGEMPYLLNPSAKKAFVVGYGGGTTVRALAMNRLQSIDVVELEPAVIEAVKRVYSGRLPTEDDKRVKISINDARNTLLMSDKHYDIIVSQPSHPWLYGASNIMNRDFFEIVKSKLTADGINGQWVPLFKIDVATLKSIIRAYTDTFEYVISFVNVPTRDFLMFGSKEPIIFDYEAIQKQMQVPEINSVFRTHNIQISYDLTRYFALSRDELVDISASAKPATDTNLLAETFYSRYYDIEGNSMDTLGFLKSHFSHDISSYLRDKVPK